MISSAKQRGMRNGLLAHSKDKNAITPVVVNHLSLSSAPASVATMVKIYDRSSDCLKFISGCVAFAQQATK